MTTETEYPIQLNHLIHPQFRFIRYTINNSNLDVENILYPKPEISSAFGDYVPLMLLNNDILMGKDIGYKCNTYYSERENIKVSNILDKNAISTLYNTVENPNIYEVDEYFSMYKEKLSKHLDSIDYSYDTIFKNIQYMINLDTHTNSSYFSMFRKMSRQLEMYGKTKIRSKYYINVIGALFDNSGGCIFTFGVHKKFVKYVKLCLILGKEIDPRVLVLFIRPGFLSPKTFNKPLRSAFRKNFKKWMDDKEIQVIETDLIKDLSLSIDTPADIKTLKMKKEYENILFSEFLADEINNW